MLNKITFYVATVLLVLALAWVGYPYVETGRISYNIIGVDVSHHQGRIDWPMVAQSGVRFAYLKATEGGDFDDPSFRENWAEAKASGLAVGAYHFYRQCKNGEEQADHFLTILPSEEGQLPPVIDVEHMGPCPGGTASFDPAKEIGIFLDAVTARIGCRPILYVTPEFDATYLRGQFETEEFWVRSIFLPPRIRQKNWLFWQYHHFGRRPGIEGPVDLNAFRGTQQEFSNFFHASGCFKRAI